MMKYYVLVFLFLFSCEKKSDKIIKEKKMIAIIKDMAEAEVFVNTYLSKDTAINKTDALKEYCDTIFSIHKIDRNMFQNSLAFYKKNPENFKSLLDSAQTETRKLSYFSDTAIKKF